MRGWGNWTWSAWRRQDLGNLRAAFQYLWGGYRKDVARLFTAVHNGKTRGNRHKLKQERLRLDIRKSFLTTRTVKDWMRLSRKVMLSLSWTRWPAEAPFSLDFPVYFLSVYCLLCYNRASLLLRGEGLWNLDGHRKFWHYILVIGRIWHHCHVLLCSWDISHSPYYLLWGTAVPIPDTELLTFWFVEPNRNLTVQHWVSQCLDPFVAPVVIYSIFKKTSSPLTPLCQS